MDVYETDLPGVGKKFALDLHGDDQLVVVIHNTGKREVFLRTDPDEDAEKLFELSDKLARTVGTILEGAYFQPIQAETIDTVVDDDSLIEWSKVTEASPIVGQTLGDAQLRQRTGASVVAIQRGDETITNPGPDTVIHPEDTLVTIGDRECHHELRALLEPAEEA